MDLDYFYGTDEKRNSAYFYRADGVYVCIDLPTQCFFQMKILILSLWLNKGVGTSIYLTRLLSLIETISNHLHQTQTHFLVYVTPKSSFTPTIYTKFKIYTILGFLFHKIYAVTPYLVLFHKKHQNEFEFGVWLEKISILKLIYGVRLKMV